VRTTVTLTTDFGTRDGFVAQMKGVILGINGDAGLVDVTHDIEPFSILEGALVLKGIARWFPPGTIHVAVVDPGVGGDRRGLALRAAGQTFIGPDNGLFSLVGSLSSAWEAREIRNSEYLALPPHPTFHGRDVFASVAGHLSLGKPFEPLGPLIHDPVSVSIPPVESTEEGLHGHVLYIDRFGNLFSNIEGATINRPAAAVRVGDVEIQGISTFFDQVDYGKPLALINSFGLLEIAVNRGDASEALGIGKGARVKVIWA
jgi:S-adenosyl-L-methionine hydrolase (adenosine-forming)